MNIKNKFEIGDEVYYPSADLRTSRLLKAEITGILVSNDKDGVESIVYQTGQSYGVGQEDMFKTAGPAKRRLIKILTEKRDTITTDIKDAIKKIKDMKPSEITLDLTNQYEESEGVEEIKDQDDSPADPV